MARQVRYYPALAMAALLSAGGAARSGELPPPTDRPPHMPEVAEMFWSITTSGADMSPGSGWFHPGQTRYGWAWLSDRLDADHDGAITPEESRLAPERFGRLDRDGNGSIRADDLDWSPRSPYQQRFMANRQRFGRLDADSNGKLTREEFQALFNRAADGKDYLTPDDLAALFAAAQQAPGAGGRAARGPAAAQEVEESPPPARGLLGLARRPYDWLFGAPEGAPTRWVLYKGLFTGEIGSPFEGPVVGQAAPDFLLPTQDGTESYRLSALRGRPVVLIFGSFT